MVSRNFKRFKIFFRPKTDKMLSPRILLLAVITFVFINGAVAPFPREDPRSVLNPLIIPWWIYTPCRVRKRIHVLVTGQPLPPDGCQKFLPRNRRPLPRRESEPTKRPKRQRQPTSFFRFPTFQQLMRPAAVFKRRSNFENSF